MISFHTNIRMIYYINLFSIIVDSYMDVLKKSKLSSLFRSFNNYDDVSSTVFQNIVIPDYDIFFKYPKPRYHLYYTNNSFA